MGVNELPQEPCVMIKNSLIVFFYVDDIVFAYGKKHDVGDLKWFLGIIKKTD